MFRRTFLVFSIFSVIVMPFSAMAARRGDVLLTAGWYTRGSEGVYQDIPVIGYAGKYIAIAAFIEAENGAWANIEGEVLNAQGRAIGAPVDTLLVYQEASDEWGVAYAVVPLPPSAMILRLHVARSSTFAAISHLAVRGVGSLAEGEAFVEEMYLNRLSSKIELQQRSVDLSCTKSRETKEIEVSVTPQVYAKNKEHNGGWILWAANETAGAWEDWGKGKMFGESWGKRASGFLCAKSGDEVRLNGMFSERDDMYLVYTRSETHSPADQVLEVRIDGEVYEIEKDGACYWDANGLGGFDVVCKIH